MQNEAQYGLDRKTTEISALSCNNLEKYEYLTGEDLGLKPSTIEQTKFEYSLLGKIFNRELDQDDTREDSFKRLRNIEGKIKSENKKESEPIKNEEQSELLKDESTVVVKKPKKIVLLKEKLDHIFRNFGSNFDSTGENFLINLAKDEKNIDYNNLIFNIDDKSVVKSVDSLEEFGTLYDLLIYLLGNAERRIISSEDQMKFFKAITVLKKIISSMKIGMTDQSEEQNKKIFAEQESVLNNAEVFFKKRNDKINQFGKNNIISNGEKFFDAPKKTEKSTPEKSFFKPIEVK